MGEIIRLLRVAYKKSLDEVAEAIGISKQYLSEIERGEKEPSIPVLDKIAEYYDIQPSTILFFKEQSKNNPTYIQNTLKTVLKNIAGTK